MRSISSNRMGENHLIKALKAGASHSKSKKFGVNRHCAKSDLMFLSCDVTSHNHFFKRLDDFMVASPPGNEVQERKRFQFVT